MLDHFWSKTSGGYQTQHDKQCTNNKIIYPNDWAWPMQSWKNLSSLPNPQVEFAGNRIIKLCGGNWKTEGRDEKEDFRPFDLLQPLHHFSPFVSLKHFSSCFVFLILFSLLARIFNIHPGFNLPTRTVVAPELGEKGKPRESESRQGTSWTISDPIWGRIWRLQITHCSPLQ